MIDANTEHETIDEELLATLAGFDTPTICNALEIAAPERPRSTGYTRQKYTAQGPGPTIVVVQDIDAQPGIAAWWGEVHTALHQGLGSLGAITNGAIRDLDDCAKGFQLLGGSIGPSHSYVHVADVGCEVEIFGMAVEHGSLIHADKHGAVLIPHEIAERLPAAIDTIVQREKVILEAIRAPDFDIDVLRKAVGESAEIH